MFYFLLVYNTQTSLLYQLKKLLELTGIRSHSSDDRNLIYYRLSKSALHDYQSAKY